VRIRLALTALFLICAATFGASTAMPARAAGITMQSQQAQNTFPDGIVFSVTATSDRKITQSRLRTFLSPRDFQNTVRGECTGDTTVTCKATFGGSIGANTAYIVPFTDIKWYWELTDEGGQTLTTPEEKVVYQDTRFRWKNVTAGNLTLWYYEGSENDVRDMLRAGRETLDKMSELMGTNVDFPVKVVEYATVRDLQLATSRGRRGGNSNSVLLGEVGTADTALATRQVFSGMADPLDTIRHELTHVVTNHATRQNRSTDSWIDEGISMYSQRVVEREYTQALDAAIKNNKAYPLSSLSSPAIRSNDSSTFYSQSHAIIKYMIDKYGESKFRDFVKALNTNDTDGALKSALGVNTNEFENGWRQSVGLPPIAAQTGTTSTGPVILTVEPLGNPVSSGGTRATPAAGTGNGSSASSGSKDGGSSALPIVGVVIAAVVVLGGAGTVLMRRKKA
jgi:hypothetical protein